MPQPNSAGRPKKPRPDFALFPHASGRWCKKIMGRHHYFGKIEGDPKGAAAIQRYLAVKDDLHAGRTPRAPSDGLTVHGLCNLFCAAKERQLDAGELARSTFADYVETCRRVITVLGKSRAVSDLRPEDFAQLRQTWVKKKCAPSTLAKEVQNTRTMFKFAVDNDLIDRPVKMGTEFKRPSKKTAKQHRQKQVARHGKKLFEPRDIRRMLKAAEQPLRAMILLGINCGFGNSDCGNLPQSAIDLRGGWIEFPRPKTAIERRCPLWPETIAALREAIAMRPKVKDPALARLVFVTKYGGSWAKETSDNPISKEVRKLLDKLDLHRPGMGFYALRHCFETHAGTDQVAIDAVMGHADNSMAAVYREGVADARLRGAANAVRRWLFRRDSADVWRPLRSR